MDNRALQLAEYARQWAEYTAEAEGLRDDLCGLCARASAYLFSSLTSEGFNAKIGIVNGDFRNHCFIILNDSVIDVTATQYGIDKKIFTSNLRDAEERYSWYRNSFAFTSLKELVKYQKRVNWTERQIPQIGE